MLENLVILMVLDVIEPCFCFVLVHDVIEPYFLFVALDVIELKKDQSRVILTADKGVAIVIMDKEEYNEKPKHYWKTREHIKP